MMLPFILACRQRRSSHIAQGCQRCSEAQDRRWMGPGGGTAVDVPEALGVNNGDVLNAAARPTAGCASFRPSSVRQSSSAAGWCACFPNTARARWRCTRCGRPVGCCLRACIDFLVERFGSERPDWDRAFPRGWRNSMSARRRRASPWLHHALSGLRRTGRRPGPSHCCPSRRCRRPRPPTHPARCWSSQWCCCPGTAGR